jgi:hypothetical protein
MGSGEVVAVSSRGSNAPETEVTPFRHNQVMAIDPSAFRTLNELLEAETKGKGRLESLGTIGVTKEERLE